MRIGIITIHNIDNYGSVLQAYALQKFLQKSGKQNTEIINYIFPNEYHISRRRKVSTIELLWCYAQNLWALIVYRSDIRKKRFIAFREKFLQLSDKRYNSITEIESNPPEYDLYITGSDQVWNPNSLFNDPTFYCHFAPDNARRISFAASISSNKFPDGFFETVRQRLSKYEAIGVRESQAAEIIKKLVPDSTVPIELNCDPTLLLSADDYAEIAEFSEIEIPEKYILVYYLDYAFSPRPAIDKVISSAKKKFNLPVIYLGVDYKRRSWDSKFLFNSGPAEFCHLFKNATYVITSSFHGLMFSLINRTPFTAIIPAYEDHDTRMSDILSVLGLNSRAVICNSGETEFNMENPYTEQVEKRIISFIQASKDFLLGNLES